MAFFGALCSGSLFKQGVRRNDPSLRYHFFFVWGELCCEAAFPQNVFVFESPLSQILLSEGDGNRTQFGLQLVPHAIVWRSLAKHEIETNLFNIRDEIRH